MSTDPGTAKRTEIHEFLISYAHQSFFGRARLQEGAEKRFFCVLRFAARHACGSVEFLILPAAYGTAGKPRPDTSSRPKRVFPHPLQAVSFKKFVAGSRSESKINGILICGFPAFN
jgi:hypothetical protein